MTNQSQKSEEIKWINRGGPHRTKDGRDIKPGETFTACPEDVPMTFRDLIKPMEQLPEERPLDVVQPQYRIVSRGPGTYNVIDGNGKVKNEKPLKQADAKALVESLS
jgi:hypothetical protein